MLQNMPWIVENLPSHAQPVNSRKCYYQYFWMENLPPYINRSFQPLKSDVMCTFQDEMKNVITFLTTDINDTYHVTDCMWYGQYKHAISILML